MAVDSLPFQPVRIGIVGLGRFGQVHARTLAGLAEAQLVAVVDSRPRARAQAKRAFPAAACFTDLSTALSESSAEAWIIAAPTAAHVPIARVILSAGLPVLLEKPIADDLAQAQSLAKLVRGDSSNLMLGHVMLFCSEVRALLAQQKQLRSLRLINSVRYRPLQEGRDYPGETPFFLTMVHDLYVVQALVQRARPTRLEAFRQGQGAGAVDVAVLQWDRGITAVLTAGFVAPPGMPGSGLDRMEVFGRDWAMTLHTNPRPVTLYGKSASWPLGLEILDDPQGPAGMLAEELRCFCRVVRGRQQVPMGASYADALQLMSWLSVLDQRGNHHARQPRRRPQS